MIELPLPEGCLFHNGENAVSSFLFLTIPGLFDLVVTTNEVGSIMLHLRQ